MIGSNINEFQKINDSLYVFTETKSVHCYLILGTEKAVVFDIGYGYENIRPMIEEVTKLPVMLVLSHGDPDHGLGAGWFEDFWMHELDYGKLLRNDSVTMRKKAIEYRYNKMPQMREWVPEEEFIHNSIGKKSKVHFLAEGDKIDLGGRVLEVLHTPGHSYGHIMLFDRKNGYLFSGDQITRHNIWYFLSSNEQAPFYDMLQSIKKVNKLHDEIKAIYPAHDVFPIGAEDIDELLECFDGELQKNYQNDAVFDSFMGKGYRHYYKHVNMIYSDERLAEFLNHDIKRV